MPNVPDDVRALIRSELGDEGVSVLDQLASLGKATDTDLAELLDAKTSTIRKALYGMYEQRVADYAEHRDPATGWLTFVWQFTPEQAARAMDEARRKAAAELRAEIEREETTEFYGCTAGHERLDFAEAMDFRFHCPTCGGQMEPDDRAARVADLTEHLAVLESGLGASETPAEA